MIKTTPMIFNSEMVRALLAGNKTQTRRIIKDQPVCETFSNAENYILYMCPFGKAGDLIYVRETFQGPLVDFEESEACAENMHLFENPNYCIYRATDSAREFSDPDGDTHYGWKPSIHMPRWASRLTLKINSVRVERIQDISKEDAIAEGFDYSKSESAAKQGFAISARTNFRHAWESIYGDSWNKNQWVWVIDFEVIHKNIDRVLEEMEQAA